MNRFEVAIIGAGPGGLAAALRASELGFKTTLIDSSHPGGTCLNTGCIPTKTLLSHARLLSKMKHSQRYGIVLRDFTIDYPKWIQRKNEVVAQLRTSALASIQKSGVEWMTGKAKLTSSRAIQIDGKPQTIEAENIVLAAGSVPSALPGFEFDHKNILSSDDILELSRVPKTLLIVGGGAVGVEFASLYQALGAKVTLVEMMERLLPNEEADSAARLEHLLSKKGIQIVTGSKIDKLEKGSKGLKAVLSKGEVVEGEKILLAIGRRANTKGMGLEEAGVRMNAKGTIEVNEYLETHVKGIYAIGDVIASPQLAHVASYEGTLVVENLKRKTRRTVDYGVIPSCVYSDPEVASVGFFNTKGEDPPIFQVRVPFAAVPKAQVEDETDGFLKLFVSAKEGRIVGAAGVGSHVTELIAEAALAIQHKLTVQNILETVHAHPSEAEIYSLAAREALKRLKTAQVS